MFRLSPVSLGIGIIALIAGLSAAYTVRQQLNQKAEPVLMPAPKPAEPMMIIPTAGKPLKVGQEVQLTDIVILRLPEKDFKDSKYAGVPFLPSTDYIIGRVLNNDIAKGATFGVEDLFSKGMGPGLTQELDADERAVTIAVNDMASVTGFAQPGVLVDVLFRSRGTATRPSQTLTLIESARVLATNDSIAPGTAAAVSAGRKNGSVTLAVTTLQAKVLRAVEGEGDLSLTLRPGPAAVEVPPAPADSPIGIDELLGHTTITPPRHIDVFLGGQRSQIRFGDYNQTPPTLTPPTLTTPVQ